MDTADILRIGSSLRWGALACVAGAAILIATKAAWLAVWVARLGLLLGFIALLSAVVFVLALEHAPEILIHQGDRLSSDTLTHFRTRARPLWFTVAVVAAGASAGAAFVSIYATKKH